MIEDFVGGVLARRDAPELRRHGPRQPPTGGRVDLEKDGVDGWPFCATYADGVADIDLGALLRCHVESAQMATMTVVQPELQFGVTGLGENGGPGVQGEAALGALDQRRLLLLESTVFEYLVEDSVLERDPLERRAAEGQLNAYRQAGFCECMDTYKDSAQLNDLCEQDVWS